MRTANGKKSSVAESSEVESTASKKGTAKARGEKASTNSEVETKMVTLAKKTNETHNNSSRVKKQIGENSSKLFF